MKRLLLVAVVLVLTTPGAAAAVRSAQATIAITPYANWTSTRANCPAGSVDLETKQVPVVYNAKGITDQRCSDFDGDGLPDGPG